MEPKKEGVPNNTVLYLHSLKYDLQARIPAPRRPNKPRRRERERERERGGGGTFIKREGLPTQWKKF